MMRQNEKSLRDPLDPDTSYRIDIHKLRIAEHKKAREQLNAEDANGVDQ